MADAKHDHIDDARAEFPVSRSRYIFAFVVLYLLFALDFAARLGVVAVFPMMKDGLGLSGTQLGLASSIVLLGMSTFVLPISFLADKTSKQLGIGIMSGIWGLGSILCGVATNFITVLAGRFLTGVGNAAFAPVSVSLLTTWTRRLHWGTAVGIYNSAMAVGLAAGTSGASYLAARYGWRSACIVCGVLTLIFGALALTLPKGGNAKTAKKVNFKEGVSVTVQNKTLILLGVGIGLVNMTLTTLVAWLPVYCVKSLHWTVPQVGAWLGPLYLINGVLMTPLGGVISDRLAKWDKRTRSWFGVPTCLFSAGLAMFGFMHGNFPLVCIAMLIAVLPITGVHIATQELVPSRYKASAYGTYVMLLQGLGFVGPVLAGALSDAYGLNTALVLIQLCIVAGGLSLLMGGFTYRKDHAKALALDAEAANT